ncbi:hypothetical protein N7532_001159 [Penicillium argentinense]|uniref:Non-structural maintenance of chromosomes element 1 homolog n=1 Tax=Penicillium argentinense TaxID=1131581 RepID=A0A9W9KL00_9EURO|nr:uncharacterized protein N7532_001159 [Penicillium argentinense]KAJ5110624.1 hypothetical protein N7532_001159 [Penicillium argentinense]
MGDYDDSNRAFLQAFMARSTMTLEEAQPILAEIISAHEGRSVSPDDITQEHFSSYISAANTAISPFDFEIRSSLHQTPKDPNEDSLDSSPTRIYALVNTTSDPLTQLATTYSADEIAFVKRVLDYMFDTNNTRYCEGMVISAMQAIQLAKVSTANDDNRRRSQNPATQATQGGAAQNLGMTQAETMMRNLVDQGWMEKSRAGNFSLTPRALLELRGWLIATYNDDSAGPNSHRADRIKFCAACKDILTVGQRCGDRDCKGRLHDHCVRNFFRAQQAEKCPICKQDWPGDKFVGERAVAASNSRQSRNVPQESVPPSIPPVVANGYAEEEDSEEDE